MSGRFGATLISTSLLASNIPVRRPWLQCWQKTNQMNKWQKAKSKTKKSVKQQKIDKTLKTVQELQGLNPYISPVLQCLEALKWFRERLGSMLAPESDKTQREKKRKKGHEEALLIVTRCKFRKEKDSQYEQEKQAVSARKPTRVQASLFFKHKHCCHSIFNFSVLNF